jgi:cytochrome c oxidase subunit 4
MGANVTENRASGGHPPESHPTHVLPASVLLGAAAALIGLTAVTVAVSRLDLGALNVVLALAIACLKASLVALFFMHLKYEKRFQAVIFLSAVFFAVVFVGFVIFDTTQYQPALRAHEAQVEAPAR